MSHSQVASIPFPPGRVENAPWNPGASACQLCRNDGVVDVGSSPTTGTGQAAPCPDCERGFMIEFGYGRETVVVGNREKTFFYRSSRPSWLEAGKPAGYWARAAADRRDLRAEVVSGPLSDEENKRRMGILNGALAAGGFTTEMLSELYRDDALGRATHDLEAARRVREQVRVAAPIVTREDPVLAEILRVARDAPCVDCGGQHPLVSYGSIRVCRNCADRRDVAAQAVGFSGEEPA